VGVVVASDRAGHLARVKVLSVDQQATLAALAQSYSDYLAFLETWELSGRKPVVVFEYQDARGKLRHRLVANPLVRVLRDQARLVAALASEFGLSPSSRAKISGAPDSAEDDPVEAFLRARPILPFSKAARQRIGTDSDDT
jgi:P27 family predicted phage terminase small subunit